MENALFWFYGLPTALTCFAICLYAVTANDYPKIARLALIAVIIGIFYFAISIAFIAINK